MNYEPHVGRHKTKNNRIARTCRT